MKKMLIILGPTATGKTDLALSLAKKFNGELISCDSRQVYKNLDLGTGKSPSEVVSVQKGKDFWILDGIKVWMYDVVSPAKQYTVYDYVKKSEKIINKIIADGKLPIIVGGSGLYLKGLLYGFSNLGIPNDEKLRRKLDKFALVELQKKLQELSSEKWESLNSSDQKNSRRLVRAIELVSSKYKTESREHRKFNTLKIGLTASKDVLCKKIDDRVEKRIKLGMIEEAVGLYKKGLSLKKMRQLGLEYGVLADFLEKKINKEELILILSGKIHKYMKRQITWFKKDKEVNWFDIKEKNYTRKVEKLVSKWYD